MTIDIHFSLSGERFSPSQLETRIGLRLVGKKEPNEPSRVDKFRSNPKPYGTATLRMHEPTNEYSLQMKALLSTMESHADAIRQCGVESMVMWIVVYAEYGEQRNLEFNPNEMGRMASLGATLAVSNYTKE